MQLCNCFLHPWYLQTLSGQVQIYFGFVWCGQEAAQTRLCHPADCSIIVLHFLICPPPHSAPQPHPHPPPLLEHILPLASVCKAVSSFQHFQQMYVELKPVSNSCVYKTLFAQTRVIHLKLKPLLSLQCRWKVCAEWNWSIDNPPSWRRPF